MCELFAISSKLPTRVTFSLEEFTRHGGDTGPHRDGWGVAFYDGLDAQIFREAEPAAYSEWMHFLQNHSHQSQCVISHIRHATQGDRALRNTQPFSRELSGRRHVFCHNGDLNDITSIFELEHFSPIGETDSEFAFCYLMGKMESIWKKPSPSLDQRVEIITEVFGQFSRLGPANFVYSDGEYLYAYANRRKQTDGCIEAPGMYYLCRECEGQLPFENDSISLSGVHVQHTVFGKEQAVVLFASVPLSDEKWLAFEENQLVVTRNGAIIQ